MYDSIDYIRRFTMSCGMRSLETSSLVDGYIYQYRTRLHHFQHITGDQVRSLVSRNQYRTYYKIHVRQLFFQPHFRGV